MPSVLNLVILLLINFTNIIASEENLPPPCFSEVYCYGRLLDTVQMSNIYKDSKTFVDMKMKYGPNETLRLFDEFIANHQLKPTPEEVMNFLNTNFDPAGMEFEDWVPSDWVPTPKFVDLIKDPKYQDWATKLNDIWKILGRKMKAEIKENKDYYSIIWIPNPVIVPGGRFREFYYWDSYWILQGLLLSEMHITVKGMLENFLYILNQFGHIPNGGRIYYLARSQPPLLTPMVKLYYDYTNDLEFVKASIETLEKEFNFWMNNHTKIVTLNDVNYTLALYGDRSSGPRPESYTDDVKSASIFEDNEEKQAFYSELKAGAESGWDFSSRWFVTNSTNKGNLTSIKTRSIIPVDLNAMIYWNADLLSKFYELLGNEKKSSEYNKKATEWLQAVEAVLWHEDIGAWLDYDIINEEKRDYFYPTNVSPLWTGCFNKTNKEKTIKNVLKYLQNENIMYQGGVPSSIEQTGEQWDYPNAWPPLQHMMIVGLHNTGDEFAMRLAYEIAERWVRTNYQAFNESGHMFEKYDATVPGGHGGGGEYDVQLGFGWTNGVIMDLLNRYADKLSAEDTQPMVENIASTLYSTPSSGISSITTALIALLVSLTAGFTGVLLYKRRTQKQVQPVETKKRPSTARYTELKNISKYSRTAR
ncbi:unnamed protein product [Psylliodes chrysocephalus]|uniref:Trehalase n=1 Tax=Psylliodes chrysocephalus TaxID=3402493 RepID=A0A9P0CL75_9CUCU|nr:unnamed protein product [Psylliodes chrysocephala]